MPYTLFCIYVSADNIYEKKPLQGLCESADSYASFPESLIHWVLGGTWESAF